MDLPFLRPFPTLTVFVGLYRNLRHYCWWKKSGVNQLRLVVHLIIYLQDLYILGGCLGFLPSTVCAVKICFCCGKFHFVAPHVLQVLNQSKWLNLNPIDSYHPWVTFLQTRHENGGQKERPPKFGDIKFLNFSNTSLIENHLEENIWHHTIHTVDGRNPAPPWMYKTL